MKRINWIACSTFNLQSISPGPFPARLMKERTPQHIGMTPDVPDFRLSCRTYTCSWLSAFLYWNMQYHVEHHMFPAVPFYHLPKLRAAIADDLPSCTHGLFATWKEIIEILKKQKADPCYLHLPQLPQSRGLRVGDLELEHEAAG